MRRKIELNNRRHFLKGLGALSAFCAVSSAIPASPDDENQIFDAHCHIIDPRFPIVSNQGYTPPAFPLQQYLDQVTPLRVTAGAVVSGSFHGFDQTYLIDALKKLGPRWVGVTQVPADIEDAEILRLSNAGVRALRFNVFRGRIDGVQEITALAKRTHAIAGWHAEIYADAAALKPHIAELSKLPKLVIDHLGMTEAGVPVVLELVDAGARIKATGFGRVSLDVPRTIETIAKRNPNALVFGTDMPSTRAQRPFSPADIALIKQVLGPQLAHKALWANAVDLYQPKV
jgi:predicted TIM-barrel fold metal-dependent hydrolase